MSSFLSLFLPAEKHIDFGVSFWAGLFSGTIYTLLLGLLLWRIQVSYEKRKLRKDNEKDFAYFRQQLYPKLSPLAIRLVKVSLSMPLKPWNTSK